MGDSLTHLAVLVSHLARKGLRSGLVPLTVVAIGLGGLVFFRSDPRSGALPLPTAGEGTAKSASQDHPTPEKGAKNLCVPSYNVSHEVCAEGESGPGRDYTIVCSCDPDGISRRWEWTGKVTGYCEAAVGSRRKSEADREQGASPESDTAGPVVRGEPLSKGASTGGNVEPPGPGLHSSQGKVGADKTLQQNSKSHVSRALGSGASTGGNVLAPKGMSSAYAEDNGPSTGGNVSAPRRGIYYPRRGRAAGPRDATEQTELLPRARPRIIASGSYAASTGGNVGPPRRGTSYPAKQRGYHNLRESVDSLSDSGVPMSRSDRLARAQDINEAGVPVVRDTLE